MKHKFARVNRKDYDNLCHDVRHLVSEVGRFDIRSDKYYRVIQDLALELNESRKTLVAKIHKLEKELNDLEGTLIDCTGCSKREECVAKLKVKVKR